MIAHDHIRPTFSQTTDSPIRNGTSRQGAFDDR